MTEPLYPESTDLIYHAGTVTAILVMMVLYSFGVWLRSYVYPTSDIHPIKRQLLASVPVGLITMAVYGKTSLAGLDPDSTDVSFDVCLMAGYIIVFGMMSRETLDRMLKLPTASSGAAARLT